MQQGKVYLVGAGPGDPGLITLKGARCVAQADLVLYDGLVNPLLLLPARGRVERTCREGGPQGRRLAQQQINERLIAEARKGQIVVRLKGGDPFIFGRGGEEAEALQRAGVPYEVVPGVTAAVGASAYAGIALTHRDHASAVAFVTGHEDPQKPAASLDYQALARFPGTLVFYMGLHQIERIAGALVAQGKDPLTPCAVVCRATTAAQRTVAAPLGQISRAARAAGLHAPSLIIVGDCVLKRDLIGWYERKPLFGRCVGVARAAVQMAEPVDLLTELGAQPILMPTIEILPPDDWQPVDRALRTIDEFDWVVFTSANGVQFLLDRLWTLGFDVRRLARARLAAMGEGTARALERYHLRADLVPGEFRAEALAAALAPRVAGCRVLWARASRGRDVLPQALREAGATVSELVVYRNVDAQALPEEALAALRAGTVDYVCLTSPSIACSFARLWPQAVGAAPTGAPRFASISPVTSRAAREAGLPVHVEAQTYTWKGLLAALVRFEEQTTRHGAGRPVD